MDPVRFGLSLRALRRRRAWTQAQLAARANVSQAAVSRAERGDARSLTLRTIDRVAEALGARTALRVLWHGEDLDRLLDAAHAGLVDDVIRLLRAHGWEVVPEATFNFYGERGSIDVLAYHVEFGALLVVEVKSVVPDLQALVAGVDRKARVAPSIAKEHGWHVRSVSRLLVLPDDRTVRRRLAEHATTFDTVLPTRTRAVRSWISEPRQPLAGILVLPASRSTSARHRVRGAASETTHEVAVRRDT